MDLKKNYISSALAQSLGRFCTMGANFLVFVLAARLLGAELFGQYSYITVYLGLAILVAEFGTTSVLAADLSKYKDTFSVYWGNFIILRFVITLIVSLVGIPIALLIRPDLFPSLMVGLIGLFFLGSRFFDPLFQVYEKPWYSFLSAVIYSIVFAILSIPVLIWNLPLVILIAMYVLANIIYTIFAAYHSYTIVRPTWKFDWSIQKKILLFAIPVGLSSIFTLVHTRADTFMLAAMIGDYAVGIYNSAYRFLDMAVIAAVMLSNPLVPIYSKIALDSREDLRQKYSQVLDVLALTIIPAAIIVPIVSGPLVKLFFGPEYSEVGPLLDIMAWIGVLSFYSLFNFVVLLATKVLRFQIWLGAVTALLNVALNYVLIPKFSFIGSAWATLLVECVFVFVSFAYIIKSIGNVINLYRLYKIAGVCLLLYLVTLLLIDLTWPLRLFLALSVWLSCAYYFKKTMIT